MNLLNLKSRLNDFFDRIRKLNQCDIQFKPTTQKKGDDKSIVPDMSSNNGSEIIKTLNNDNGFISIYSIIMALLVIIIAGN